MVRVIPLGGLGEIGLNAMVFEAGEELVLVDCGLMFPRELVGGVDIILPDFEYLRANAHKLKAVVITHAHEDHLGALPFLLRELQIPVFAPKFAAHLLRHKLEEQDVDAEIHEISPGEIIRPSESFEIEPVRMCHSVPEAMGHLIRAHGSQFFHTGDWKIDETPLNGWATDFERLERAGAEGLTALFSDSTNSELHTHTPSETVVAETFDRLFQNAEGRIIVSMFASHIGRIQCVMDLCRKFGRKLMLSGRTLQRNVEIGQATGHLSVPPGLLIAQKETAYFPPKLTCMLVTGSQAEPRSHLVQMAGDAFPLRFDPTDLVILSARAIPGNETAIGAMIDKIIAHGAKVAYWRTEPGVHVSGHASAVEQHRLIQTLEPRNFIPIHGELRHLHCHLETAKAAGVRDEGRLLARDGDVIRFDADQARLDGRVAVGRVYRDRDGVGVVPEAIIRERGRLATASVVMAVVVINRATGVFVAPPQLYGRAVTDEEAKTLELGVEEVRLMMEETSVVLRGDDAFVKEELVRCVRKLFKTRGLKRPTVLPAVVKL